MKNKLLLLFIVTMFLTAVKTYAQDTKDSVAAVANPEKRAEFKGGLNAWSKFLETNLDRNLLTRQGAPGGRYTVIGNFLIDSEGAIHDIQIERDPGYGTAAEFTRILKLSSKNWSPAFDKGKPVPYRHKQSLTFVN